MKKPYTSAKYYLAGVILIFLLWMARLLAVDSLSLSTTDIDDNVIWSWMTVATITWNGASWAIVYSMPCINGPKVDDAKFSIGWAWNELIINEDPDYVTQSSYDICIMSTDLDWNKEHIFTLQVEDRTVPEFNSITVSSSNSNSWYAKEWDTITFSVNLLNPDSSWNSNELDFSIWWTSTGNVSINSNTWALSSHTWTVIVWSGQYWIISVSNLIFSDYYYSNYLSWTVDYTLSQNIIVDTIAPTINFTNDVSSDSNLSDTIEISVTDWYIDSSSLKYGFSDNTNCSTFSNYDQLFSSNNSFTLSGVTNNWKYICVQAVDLAWNVSYLASTNKLNIAEEWVVLSGTWINENTWTWEIVWQLSTVRTWTWTDSSYELVNWTSYFEIFQSWSSEWWLKTTFDANYETWSGYTVRIKSVDTNSGEVESNLTIQIYDVNEAPTGITIDTDSIDENKWTWAIVGILDTLDDDTFDTHKYELLDWTWSFALSETWVLTAITDFDFESASGYILQVKTTENTLSWLTYTWSIEIKINNENDNPTNLIFSWSSSITENTISGTLVWSFSTTDQDADTFTYTLVEWTWSENNSSFGLSSSWILTVSGSINYEYDASYSIRVRSTDSWSWYIEDDFEITILNQNESPTSITLSWSSISENALSPYYVWELITADQDNWDTFVYTLSWIFDNAQVTLSGSKYIYLNNPPNFETHSGYTIHVQTQDMWWTWITYEKDILINVIDENEAPYDIDISTGSIDENKWIWSVVWIFTTDDPDWWLHTYELLDWTWSFVLNETWVLTTKEVFDFETQSGYTINVKSIDNEWLSKVEQFIITIEDVNQWPTDLQLSWSWILENRWTWVTIWTFSWSDDGEYLTGVTTLIYTLSESCTWSDDNGSFSMSGSNTLVSNATFNYEWSQQIYTICANVSDGTNNYYTNFDIYVIDENETPTKINLSTGSIKENSWIWSEVWIFTTEDPDWWLHTYELLDWTWSFQLSSTWVLTTKEVFDYETSTGYTINVKSIDNEWLSREEQFIITIEDVNQWPTDLQLSWTWILENRWTWVTIGTFSWSDDWEDDWSLTYSLVTSCATWNTDNGSFDMSGATTLISNATFNYEWTQKYTICARVSDWKNSIDRNFDIEVIDVNEAPTDIGYSGSLNLNENAWTWATVLSFTTTDPESFDPHTYQLLDWTWSFELSNTWILTTKKDFDFETESGYTLLVRSSDNGLLFKEKSFTITINDVNQGPTNLSLSWSTILENTFVWTTIWTFSWSDDGENHNTLTYTLTWTCSTWWIDNSMFNIDWFELKTATPINFESWSTLSICVNVSDWLYNLKQDFTINIWDINESPYDFIFNQNSFDENTATWFLVWNLSSLDEDVNDSHTYDFETWIWSTDNDSFNLSSTWALISKFSPNFEIQSLYSVKFKVTDKGGITKDLQKTIVVDDVNEKPTDISLSWSSIDENIWTWALVWLFDTIDEDKWDSHTYSFTWIRDNAKFRIVWNALITDFSADFETKSAYSIGIRSTDWAGLYTEEIFPISINNVDETWFTISLSWSTLLENTAIWTTVWKLSTTSSNTWSTSYTYTLLEWTGSFEIDWDDIKSKISPNFESGSIYNISVLSEDNLWHTGSRDFTINILNQNENPISLSLSWTTIDENTMWINIVWTFTTSDIDLNDTHTYNLVWWTWSNDNTGFTIIWNTLLSSFTSDFETKEFYYIRVRSTDAGLLKTEEEFTIRINNLPENPTDISFSWSLAIDENTASGVTLWSFSTTWTNSWATYTYTLSWSIWDNDSFTISWNDLVTNFVWDYEVKDDYTILVRSTDNQWYFFEESYIISVNNKNEQPTDITLTPNSVLENSATWTIVWTLSTLLFDFWDSYNYAFAIWAWDTDNNLFAISGSNLVTNYVFDKEVKDNYTVRIISTDTWSLTTEKSFTINIQDKNTQPTDIALSGTGIDENLPTWTLIWNLSWTDDWEDTGLTFDFCATWWVDNNKFTITWSILSGYTLQSNKTFDYEIDGQNQNICITVNDWSLSYNENFVIGVNNLVENPTDIIFSWSQDIPENTASWTTLWSFSSVWVNVWVTYNYTLSGSDSSFFRISGWNNLVIDFVPNYEDRPTPYNIWVNTTDSYSWTFDKQFQFTINNQNNAPTDIALSGTWIDENNPSETFIGTFTWTDDWENLGTLSYSLNCATWWADNSSFSITWSTLSWYTLWSNWVFNFENKSTYDICVELSDWDLTYTEDFTITVNDLNESPTDIILNPSALYEWMLTWSTVWDFSTTDQDWWNHTYALVLWNWSDDNDSFTITWSTLKTNFVVDFENKNSYKIRVKSTDNWNWTLSFEKEFTLIVTNINNAPTNIVLSWSTINENQPALTFIWDLTWTDDWEDNGTLDYSFCATWWVDNNNFTITGSTLSGYKLLSNWIFDYENDASYNVCIRVSDWAYNYDKIFTILINDVTESPTNILFSWSLSLNENLPFWYNVGDFSTVWTNSWAIYTYSLVWGTWSDDNASFTIYSWSTSLITNFATNYETKSTYYIRVRSTDNLLQQIERQFIITISNQNSAPTDIALTNNNINENLVAWTTIWTVSWTDDWEDNGVLSYSMTCTTPWVDDASFTLSGTTLSSNASFDYETKNTYNICIRATDWNLTYDENFVIAVNDISEAWTDITFSWSLTLAENTTSWLSLWNFNTVWTNSWATYIYTFVNWAWSDDNTSFIINSWSTNLITAFIPNYETKNTYSIRVRSTDNFGLIVEKQFSVIISNVNENPIDMSISSSIINENLSAWTTVWALTTTDPDPSNTYTYTLVVWTWSDNNASFGISWNNLVANFTADYEVKNSYTVRLRSTDNGWLFTEKQFTISIGNVSEWSSGGGGGWSGAGAVKDNCPSWDYSYSYYDKTCGTKPKTGTWTTTWTWMTSTWSTQTWTTTWTWITSSWSTTSLDDKIEQIIDKTFKAVVYWDDEYIIRKTKTWKYIIKNPDGTYEEKVFSDLDKAKKYIDEISKYEVIILDDYDFDEKVKPVVYVSRYGDRFIARKLTNGKYILYSEKWLKLNWFFNKQYEVLLYLQKIFWKHAFSKAKHTS